MIRADALFSDHMVLQRSKEVPIWGTGSEGERVTVECAGFQVGTEVADGGWKAVLPPQEAGGPYELRILSGEQTIVLRDVWFGDVWLAGGQSNMEWSLADSVEGPREIPFALLDNLRYYQVPKITYEDGVDHPSSWVVCAPDTAPVFSAVAYFFAKRVMEEEHVPIGLIGCNWGGTSATCWVGEQVLQNDPELRVYLDDYQEKIRGRGMSDFEEAEQRYVQTIEDYNDRIGRGLTGDQLGDYPWPPPLHPRSFLRPNGLYETMLRKTVPYSIRGFLYYQGESDADKPLLYERLLSKMIENWREDRHDPQLPFLFVQLPVFGCDGDPDGDNWALLRESQWLTSRRVPNVWVAAAWEHGDKDDIHPVNKKPVGDRLALLALEHVYGRETVSSGPVMTEFHKEQGRAIVRFAQVADGLGIRGGDTLFGFEIAGDDGVFSQAQAVIQGADAVQLWNEQVTDPVAVRYGWSNYSEGNLMNGAGLPAFPFRTNGRS
ncbi:MAG: sialate O-acetylesterase [Cohnella sp.]|nr:sialate O-acetylesterase [Cohnella sp.]